MDHEGNLLAVSCFGDIAVQMDGCQKLGNANGLVWLIGCTRSTYDNILRIQPY